MKIAAKFFVITCVFTFSFFGFGQGVLDSGVEPAWILEWDRQ
jgi:hypothetical protein